MSSELGHKSDDFISFEGLDKVEDFDTIDPGLFYGDNSFNLFLFTILIQHCE
jgi:hypothetical protein